MNEMIKIFFPYIEKKNSGSQSTMIQQGKEYRMNVQYPQTPNSFHKIIRKALQFPV